MVATIIICLAVSAALTIIIFSSLVIVPTVKFGMITRFKKRSRFVKEGVHFALPFIDSVEVFDAHLQTTPIKVSVESKDKQEISIEGSLQWVPDFDILNQYVEMEEKTITTGISDAVKSTLGDVAGRHKCVAFIEKKRAVEFLINCVLRLSAMPEAAEVPPIVKNKILKYYETKEKDIEQKLSQESGQPNDRSAVEMRYGIDIKAFVLSDIKFSEKTQASFEKGKQAAADAAAATTRIDKVVQNIEALKNQGVDPQSAVLAAASANGIQLNGNILAGLTPLGEAAAKIVESIRGQGSK